MHVVELVIVVILCRRLVHNVRRVCLVKYRRRASQVRIQLSAVLTLHTGNFALLYPLVDFVLVLHHVVPNDQLRLLLAGLKALEVVSVASDAAEHDAVVHVLVVAQDKGLVHFEFDLNHLSIECVPHIAFGSGPLVLPCFVVHG